MQVKRDRDSERGAEREEGRTRLYLFVFITYLFIIYYATLLSLIENEMNNDNNNDVLFKLRKQ